MLVQFAVQAKMLANMEFEFECFFTIQMSKSFQMFFIVNEWTFTHVSQTKKLSKQTGLRRPLPSIISLNGTLGEISLK